jgi:hypothetical protein
MFLVVALVQAYRWLAGSDDAKVSIECQADAAGIDCHLRHVSGGASAHVCWTVALGCQNGVEATAHACRDVKPGASATRHIAVSKIARFARCDRAVSIKLLESRVTTP